MHAHQRRFPTISPAAPESSLSGGMTGWGNAATARQLEGDSESTLEDMVCEWLPAEPARLFTEDGRGGIYIAAGDPATETAPLAYVPGMAPTGTDFQKDTIRALNAMLGGLDAAEGGTAERYAEGEGPEVSDLDFQIFADLRLSGTGDKRNDPDEIRAGLTNNLRKVPAWQAAVDEQTVAVQGDVVRDYLEQGVLSDDRVVIGHARFNEGEAQHISGIVYWNPKQGMCLSCGTEDELRAPPMMVLKHELTHAWMDHYFAADRILQTGEEQVAPPQMSREESAAWTARLEAFRAQDAQRRAREQNTVYLNDPIHPESTIYSPEVYEAILNGQVHLGSQFHSNQLLLSRNDETQAPYGETYGGLPANGPVPAYEEEEMNTDSEYRSVETLRDWARAHAPHMLQSGGQLEELGNRTSYNQTSDFYEATGPLSTRRADR